MPTYFIHLENALKRANEFIEVQNKLRALEILCDVLHSKKHRTWQKKHEEIMMKYLELCVELKQSYVAKEGIYQYKIICQQSYIGSFEDVIRKYIAMAEAKANEAKEESQVSIADVDDLENAQTPEDILMSAVSNEGNQDRKDRVVLIPWVKFLWESYRQCLDLLRHNNKTERLYHDIAHQAFKFCIKYNRKSEFRKLCDHLHLHIDQLKRQQTQQQSEQQKANSINLNSPETQALQLETRLIQLDFAIQLELWQEAYRATDDIKKFNLMNLTKKGLGKPQLIASYYQKLALVFWKASSHLFHAAAQFRLFHLSKELRKNLSADEIQKMSSRLVLAVLSIPIPAIRPEIDKLVDTEENVIDQHHRNLSMLLGITSKPPTRASLIKDLKRMGVLQFASPQIQELFSLLEAEFNPLSICTRVQSIIDYIEKVAADPAKGSEEMLQYIPALKEVTSIRLIREVSQVYKTIDFPRLLELCPFVNKCGLEKLVVESARRHDLQVRIDHRKGCFIFGTELRVSTGDEFVEGPYLQSMPNEQMRRQLVSMYSSLQKALHLIDSDSIRKEREALKRQTMRTYHAVANVEHRQILNRQNLIEKRREMMEQIGMQREMHERKRIEEEEARRRVAEEARLLEETKERERIRREKDEKELMKQMTMDQLKKMKDALPDLRLDDLDEEELAKLKPQDLHAKRVEQLEKGRKEAQAKQRKVERKLDHFERAKRVEELPLLQKQYEEWRVTDREVWDQCEILRIEAMKAEREVALKERERFRRVLGDKEEFTRRVLETRRNEYEERLNSFEAIVNEERKKRLAARREKRIEERRVRYHKEKEAARLASLAAQEEKQRKRMAEIEEKIRQQQQLNEEKESVVRNGVRPSAAPLQQEETGGGGNWRARATRPKEAELEPQPMRRNAPPSAYPPSSQQHQEETGGGNWRSRAPRPKEAELEPQSIRRNAPPSAYPPSSQQQQEESGGGSNWRTRAPRPKEGELESQPMHRAAHQPAYASQQREQQQQDETGGGGMWRRNRPKDGDLEQQPMHRGASSQQQQPPPQDDGEGQWRQSRQSRPRRPNITSEPPPMPPMRGPPRRN